MSGSLLNNVGLKNQDSCISLTQFNLISAGTFCGLFPKSEAAEADSVYYVLLIQFQIVSLRR